MDTVHCDETRRCWTEVDLQVLSKNLLQCIPKIKSLSHIMAVVKADAYGHGDCVVAKHLSDLGVCFFAVSNIEEAIKIRKAGVKGVILILGYTPINRANDLVTYDIQQSLISQEYADLISKTQLPIKCQFALDTGMRRIGLNTDNLDECETCIREYSKRLIITGLFTHLCVADNVDQNEYTNHQISVFEEIALRVSDLKLPYLHCMNSAGILWHHSRFSFISRIGIIMYGLKPDYFNDLPNGIEPVLSWKSVVAMVKEVRPGDSIGYGRSFIVNKPMLIATIPTGYADGYPRALSNIGYVLINGKKAPIVGRICMDQMMVDVTEIPKVNFETEVVLIGKSGNIRITADDLAHRIGTIGYEIICGISKRVERVYI